MSSILKVISLPPEWFELLLELEDELSRCNGFRWLPLSPAAPLPFCGIEYMGMVPRLVPGCC